MTRKAIRPRCPPCRRAGGARGARTTFATRVVTRKTSNSHHPDLQAKRLRRGCEGFKYLLRRYLDPPKLHNSVSLLRGYDWIPRAWHEQLLASINFPLTRYFTCRRTRRGRVQVVGSVPCRQSDGAMAHLRESDQNLTKPWEVDNSVLESVNAHVTVCGCQVCQLVP